MAYISRITLPNGESFDIRGKNIISDTTEGWASRSTEISQEGFIYVYTDYQILDDQYIPGIKIGTGNAYIIDLPFIDAVYAQHIADTIVHITQEERDFWNNKVTCYIDENEEDKLIITKT